MPGPESIHNNVPRINEMQKLKFNDICMYALCDRLEHFGSE